ncbi:hypothetical protein M409DRAFT_56719 [Zasmidium cellare ATCC 36951]|uniref:Uncharacterized protein n=1 Tax=Zasmidium cellare ATCC 36951 TaxID=1080233 RepID=A0A6A6CB82_ZASCE|nr:uncharacterized protein M409DRAFT_56719 [Zasmidium cellare ATCC 36951]KAF2164457.1 hypothetical protein M409DRAFT_56719 [Zasmidium cellare ATCC 36951]
MAYFQTKGVAFVTGSAGGIGQGAANALAAAGATAIAFADIDEARVKAAAEESKKHAIDSNYRVKAFRLDTSDRKAVEEVVQAVAEEFGRIDYLVHSAGVDQVEYAPVPDDDPDDFDRVQRINATGLLNVSRAVAKVMEAQEPRQFTTVSGTQRDLGRGVIVNVASAAAFVGIPAKVGYVASKWASLGITKTLAVDLAPKGIRVNCMCPTWVDTPMFKGEQEKIPPITDLIKKINPAGRPAEVDEVGNSIVYLCSPAASYVNGHALTLDAGMTAGPMIT